MNFLAHLHLADNSKTSMAANLAGDFSKGSIENHPKHLQQGIWLHRQIDKLTDSHELTLDLRHEFPSSLTRVAPILIDLAFDHMLAKYWDEYHNQPLKEFALQTYEELTKAEQLPAPLIDVIKRMTQDNWLVQYQTRQGLNSAITAVAQRLSQPKLFDGAIQTVEKLDIEIEIAFRTFYPQLMAYSRIWARKTPTEFL